MTKKNSQLWDLSSVTNKKQEFSKPALTKDTLMSKDNNDTFILPLIGFQ